MFPLSDYVARGIMTPGQMETLIEAVKDHRNVLISGGTGTGKSTLEDKIKGLPQSPKSPDGNLPPPPK